MLPGQRPAGLGGGQVQAHHQRQRGPRLGALAGVAGGPHARGQRAVRGSPGCRLQLDPVAQDQHLRSRSGAARAGESAPARGNSGAPEDLRHRPARQASQARMPRLHTMLPRMARQQTVGPALLGVAPVPGRTVRQGRHPRPGRGGDLRWPPRPRQVAQGRQRPQLQALVHAALDLGPVRAQVAGNRRHRLAARIGEQDPRPLNALRRFGPRAGDAVKNAAQIVLDHEPRPPTLERHTVSPMPSGEAPLPYTKGRTSGNMTSEPCYSMGVLETNSTAHELLVRDTSARHSGAWAAAQWPPAGSGDEPIWPGSAGSQPSKPISPDLNSDRLGIDPKGRECPFRFIVNTESRT